MASLDPTGTTLLRRRFMNQILKRTRDLVKDIVDLIVGLDVFGLAPSRLPFTINVEREAWRFLTDDRKLGEFQNWFQEQIDLGLLAVDPITGAPWTAEFVESSYRKGVVDAFNKTRKTAGQEAGFVAGSQAEFLTAAFSSPEAVSKIRLLSTRTFEQLKGITDTMSQGIARELATGLSQGIGPREIARRITTNISGISRRRALVISRTEIVNAHAEGSLDAFEQLGVDELNLMAEFSTTGDDRVCPLCAPLEGTVFTVKEARGIIPRHPNCRCAWIPANVGEKQKAGRAVTKAQVEARVETSLKAELPKSAKTRTAQAARRRSESALASARITKRPTAVRRSLGKGTPKSTFRSKVGKSPETIALEKQLDQSRVKTEKARQDLKTQQAKNKKSEEKLKKLNTQTKTITDDRDAKLKQIADLKVEIKQSGIDNKRIERALAAEDRGGRPALETVNKIRARKGEPALKPIPPSQRKKDPETVKLQKQLDKQRSTTDKARKELASQRTQTKKADDDLKKFLKKNKEPLAKAAKLEKETGDLKKQVADLKKQLKEEEDKIKKIDRRLAKEDRESETP